MSSERSGRVHRRHTVAWKVDIKATEWRDVVPLTTSNVSRGGLFVQSSSPLAVGTRIEVMLWLPDGNGLTVGGTVVHSIAAREGMASGFGVKFDDVHTAELSLLEAMAASHVAGSNTYTDDLYVTLPALISGGQGEEATSAHHLVAPSAEPAEPAPEPAPAPAAIAGIAVDDDTVFGVDFGTSYSSIAVLAGGRLHVLEDDDGNALFPSIVSYPDSGSPLVGWAAREAMAAHPSTTLYSPKRLLGRRFDDRNVGPFLHAMAVRTSAGPDGSIVASIYGEPVAIPQVCAEVFRHLARVAEARTGQPPRRIVVSAPVGYEAERAAILRSAQIAGLSVDGVIDEPFAAALAYGAGRGVSELIAIYDFGGGTFDFTLIRIENRRYEVVGMAGDPWLGGDDFDLALADHVANAFWRETKVELRQRQVEWQRLQFLCEAAKRKLSVRQQVDIEARGIALSVRGGIDLRVSVDRSEFDALCKGLVDRSIDTVDSCFSLSGLSARDVDRVVMIGGVSRIPCVIDRVREYFEKDVGFSVNPEQAIVAGNAIYGAVVARNRAAQRAWHAES